VRWLLLSLWLLIAPVTLAQEDVPPIIALNDGGIYAVSPLDGSTETLVEPPLNYSFILENFHDPVTVFSAEWLSGQYIAYRTLRRQADNSDVVDDTGLSHALFVLDVQNGGEPIPVQVGTNYRVQSVAWSLDGTRLYAVISTPDSENGSLVSVERDAWDAPTVVELPPLEYAMARRVYPTADGTVVVDRGIQSLRRVFTVFDGEGEQINQFEVDFNISPDVNLYINTPFTPMLVDGTPRYALVHQFTGELLFQVDFASGEVLPVESGYFPAVVSALAPDTSLRLSAGQYNGEFMIGQVRSPQSTMVGSIDRLRAYTFGIAGDSVGTPFALSPDGQTIAYLLDGTLMLWQGGESTALDVTAEALAWSPMLNVPVYDPNYLRG
jgi:hypothetical protein